MTSNEYYLGLPNGNVVKSRSVTRVVPSGRWDSKSILGVKGIPGKLTMSVEEEIDIEAMPDITLMAIPNSVLHWTQRLPMPNTTTLTRSEVMKGSRS